jgi:hypothetical protein
VVGDLDGDVGRVFVDGYFVGIEVGCPAAAGERYAQLGVVLVGVWRRLIVLRKGVDGAARSAGVADGHVLTVWSLTIAIAAVGCTSLLAVAVRYTLPGIVTAEAAALSVTDDGGVRSRSARAGAAGERRA